MTHPDEPARTDNPLRPICCPECGYSLTGLHDEGLCPECGSPYDNETIVLYGWKGRQSPGWSDTWWGRTIVVAVMLGLLTGPTIGLASRTGLLPVAVVLPGSIAVVAMIVYRRRRQVAQEVPPVQVRLSPAGLGQRTGFGPVNLERWTLRMIVAIQGVRPGLYRLTVKCTKRLALRVRAEVVDIEFKSDAACAERVQQQIGRWWFLSQTP